MSSTLITSSDQIAALVEQREETKGKRRMRSDDEKRRDRREANRKAAQESRKRQKMLAESLETTLNKLQSENEYLEKENKALCRALEKASRDKNQFQSPGQINASQYSKAMHGKTSLVSQACVPRPPIPILPSLPPQVLFALGLTNGLTGSLSRKLPGLRTKSTLGGNMTNGVLLDGYKHNVLGALAHQRPELITRYECNK